MAVQLRFHGRKKEFLTKTRGTTFYIDVYNIIAMCGHLARLLPA